MHQIAIASDACLRLRMANAAHCGHAEKHETKDYLRRQIDLWRTALAEATPHNGGLNAHHSKSL